MKLLSKLMALFLMVGFAACSEEQGDTPIIDPVENGDGIYSTLSLSFPQTRSTQSEGNEEGQGFENAVGSILVVLAEKTTEGASDTYKFITFALNDSPITTGNANSTHTIIFQDKETLLNKAGSTVYVFAYCNPTEALRSKIAGTFDAASGGYKGGLQEGTVFTDEICNTDVEKTWSKNGFLMTSVKLNSIQLPEKTELQGYNTPANPFKLGTVEVIRTACRFDFRDASEKKNLTYGIYEETYSTDNGEGTDAQAADGETTETSGEDTPQLIANVKLTRVALFNLRQQFYYLPRISKAGTMTLCPGFMEMEVTGNDSYVLSPTGQPTFAFELPERIDPAERKNTAGLEWTELSQIIDGTADIDEGWGSGITDKEGYHIWRYATENTFGPQVEPATENTTGYVFESEILVADDFGNKTEDGTYEPMYLYNDKLYPSAKAIATAVENKPVSTLATAFAAAFDKSGEGDQVTYTPKDDATLEKVGFTVYKPVETTAANGEKETHYYAYYFAFNRHNDNNKPYETGAMEFGTVRNNVYKFAVKTIKKFGTFKPSDNVEEWDTYFEVLVMVKPWTVRVNDLEF